MMTSFPSGVLKSESVGAGEQAQWVGHLAGALARHSLLNVMACKLTVRGNEIGKTPAFCRLRMLCHLAKDRAADFKGRLVKLLLDPPGACMAGATLHGIDGGVGHHLEGSPVSSDQHSGREGDRPRGRRHCPGLV